MATILVWHQVLYGSDKVLWNEWDAFKQLVISMIRLLDHFEATLLPFLGNSLRSSIENFLLRLKILLQRRSEVWTIECMTNRALSLQLWVLFLFSATEFKSDWNLFMHKVEGNVLVKLWLTLVLFKLLGLFGALYDHVYRHSWFLLIQTLHTSFKSDFKQSRGFGVLGFWSI